MKKSILVFLIAISIPVLSYSQTLNWFEQTSGSTQTLTSAHTSSTAPNSPSYVWVCGYGGTVLRSTNDGANWLSAGGNGIPATTQLINIVGIDANTAVTAGYVGANTFVYRTSNAGANWTQVFTETNGFINAMCFRNSLSGFMTGDPVGGRWSLWKTTNGGVSWDSSGMYLPQIGAEAGWNNSVWNIGDKIWFGTNNTKIYYSTNFGSSWTAQTTTGSLNSYAVWFSPIGGGNEGLMGGADMYRSSNYGANWTLQASAGTGNFGGITGGPNLIVSDLFFVYTFAVRGTTALYASTNNGTNWFINNTASAGNYRYIGTNYYGNKFWGVRSNGGISYLNFLIGGINTVNNGTPEGFSLSQNYPNPFNPETKIQFQIQKASDVKLTVFDQLGRTVASLVNERLAAGTYETEFNAAGIVSGVYFYKLEAGDFSEIKKMMLIK
ncbi:MAG: T9SS type A sorting domain-containing protein [Ignavibacteria bacterium]|nr:T9SS type A sorting domain-containing protein [Ignavibacteria bacterium]